MLPRQTALLAALLLLVPSIARSERPAVAEASIVLDAGARALGPAFFLPLERKKGVVAVMGGGRVDPATLRAAPRVIFRLEDGRTVSTSKRFYAPPRSIQGPGWDFVTFALDARPQGVRVLKPETRKRTEVADRVRILPASGDAASNGAARWGTVVRVDRDRIEVVPDGLEPGWEGAPILSSRGRIVAIAQDSLRDPTGATRLVAMPIARVVQSLKRPARQVGDPVRGGIPFAELSSRRVDVLLLLDTSVSTNDMTGVDLNGNGVVGKRRPWEVFGGSDAGDSILQAEVRAARHLLRQLDPRNARVGLVSFASRQGPVRTDAVTEVPLTADYEQVDAALSRVLARGANGATNLAAGVDRATVELLGLEGALSVPDPIADRLVFLLTDGRLTRPYGPGYTVENRAAVARAAVRADGAGIRFHTFAIGSRPPEDPRTVSELAALTGGRFSAVQDARGLPEALDATLGADALRPRPPEGTPSP